VCEKEVLYMGGRRRCSSCKRWCHDGCSLRNGPRYDDRSTCAECLFEKGPTLAQIELSAEDLDKGMSTDPRMRTAALVLLTSLWVGPDEARIAEITGLPPEEIAPCAANCRASQVWTDDGKIGWDELDEPENPQHVSFAVIIMILCANGEVVRRRADPGVPSPDEVRTERPEQ